MILKIESSLREQVGNMTINPVFEQGTAIPKVVVQPHSNKAVNPSSLLSLWHTARNLKADGVTADS